LFLPLVWRAFGAKPVEGVFFTFPVSDGLSSILSCIFIKSEFSKWAKLETGAETVKAIQVSD
jgi:hypothetical protein